MPAVTTTEEERKVVLPAWGRLVVNLLACLMGLPALLFFVLGFTLLLGLAALNIPEPILSWDIWLYKVTNGINNPAITSFIFTFLNDPGLDYFVFLAASVAYVWLRRRRDMSWAVLANITSLLVGTITIDYAFHFGVRARPFTVVTDAIVDEQWRQVWLGLPSFPSGHMREVTGLGVVLLYFWPASRWPAIAYVVTLGFTRVYLGSHYPSDVLGGMLIGLACGLLAVFAVQRVRLLLHSAGETRAVRNAYAAIFQPHTDARWDQDAWFIKAVRLGILVGLLLGSTYLLGRALHEQSLGLFYWVMRNLDNSIMLPLLARYQAENAPLVYTLLLDGFKVPFALGAVTLIYAFVRRREQLEQVVLALLGILALTQAMVLLVGPSFPRPQPFAEFSQGPDEAWRQLLADSSAFPSRHVLLVAALGLLLAYLWPRAGWLVFGYVLAVAAGLFYFGAGWPMDVFASILAGYATAQYSLFLARNALAPPDPSRRERAFLRVPGRALWLYLVILLIGGAVLLFLWDALLHNGILWDYLLSEMGRMLGY